MSGVSRGALNHLIICDPETGTVYKATDVVLDASKIEFPEVTFVSPGTKLHLQPQDDKNIIGHIDSGKMVFFESRKGPVDDLMAQMMVTDLSSVERDRVLAAKTAFDAKSSKLKTTIKCTSELKNG